MKVTATENGFYGRYINKGESFEVPNGTKGSWFAPAKRVAASAEEAPASDSSDDGKAADLV